MLWGCNIAAVAVMLFRLFLRKYRGSMFRLSDHLTFVAIACLFGRLSMMHVATLWGTNQFTGKPKTLKQTEIDQRRIGSILRLVSRPLLNT